MEPFAAGIIPYIFTSDLICYYLLGLEKSNNLWSGFVGNSNEGETITDTALREFNEETVFIFEEYIPFIKEKLKDNYYKDTTSTCKDVYIYFIEFPIESQEKIKDFMNKKSKCEEEHFHEKSILRWFTIDEIKKSKKIFYRLKKMLLHF
jgi:8-oxo-dGTP pyrophosphatase MutT (NUDIX family)